MAHVRARRVQGLGGAGGGRAVPACGRRVAWIVVVVTALQLAEPGTPADLGVSEAMILDISLRRAMFDGQSSTMRLAECSR